MEVLLALASGVLYAAGIYLMLRRRLAQLIIGLGLLSNGTNLLILPRADSPGPGRQSSRKARQRSNSRTPIPFHKRSS